MTEIHIDLTWVPMTALAVSFFGGWLGFESTVVLLLAVGLPYGGPP